MDRSDAPPLEELRRWIKELYGHVSIDEVERINLTTFLRESARFKLEPAERLRQLAIEVDSECGGYGARGWSALNRIYALACGLDKENVAALHSAAISARWIADSCDGPEADKIWSHAMSAIRKAIDLAPEDGDVHEENGMILYFRGQTREARQAFDTALDRNANLAWAQLYRAHCLHDEKRWRAALTAYSAVNKALFTGTGSWRVDVLREQQAQCRLMMGDRDGALADLERILERYEREPHLAFWAMSSSLWEAAEGELKSELHDRVLAVDRLAAESQA